MRTFFIIWLGEFISILGSGLTSFALAVWIYRQTGQATPFALTILFGTLPRILLTPLAGSLADRGNRRRIMILADTGSALATLAIVLVLVYGELQVWNIYLLALVGAAFAAFQEPAYTASISMLVPKENLARASGMIQMGQAIEMILSPILAGFLFVAIGLNGIILIDFITFFFAVGALLIVNIPQPRLEPVEAHRQANFLRDAAYGWQYLRERAGLFGLLWYYALVNFLLNLSGVLIGPLVLSFSNPGVYGPIQMVFGLGMLGGSILMSAWGGPKRRVYAVIGFIALAGAGQVIGGLRPNVFLIGLGLFLLTFCVPLASGPSQAIFQSKIEPSVQGRVFAMRILISRSMLPLAYLLAGPLADYVFGPLMNPGGALASTPLGAILGAGPGRGIGLIYVVAGLTLLLASGLAFANPRIRNVEDELPDIAPQEAPKEAEIQNAIAEPGS